MKKIIIKIITIIIAFVAGVVTTSYLYNKGNLDMTAHMAEATLPILYYEYDGEYVNPTYGYTSKVDPSCMRSAILPMDVQGQAQSSCMSPHWPINHSAGNSTFFFKL